MRVHWLWFSFQFSNQFTAQNPLAPDANNGNAIASFALGDVFTANVVKSQPLANERRYLQMFIQDDWKVTRKLTVNIGTDYSLEFPITERYDRKMWFDPTAEMPVKVGFPVIGAFKFAGSGTRTFFEAQLTNLNGGTPVVYGPGVDTNMHENTDTVLASDPNAVAPRPHQRRPRCRDPRSSPSRRARWQPTVSASIAMRSPPSASGSSGSPPTATAAARSRRGRSPGRLPGSDH